MDLYTDKMKKPGQPAGKPEVELNGALYKLRFDLQALEQIEAEFGGLREAFQALRGGGMVKAVKKLFAILANSQRDYEDKPMDVTEDTVGRHTGMAKLVEISAAIQAAVEKGMESETNGGEADDEEHDALAEIYDEKNG
jgi:hypothetical protein